MGKVSQVGRGGRTRHVHSDQASSQTAEFKQQQVGFLWKKQLVESSRLCGFQRQMFECQHLETVPLTAAAAEPQLWYTDTATVPIIRCARTSADFLPSAGLRLNTAAGAPPPGDLSLSLAPPPLLPLPLQLWQHGGAAHNPL